MTEPSAQDVKALRALLSFAGQPTPAKQARLAHDWRDYPFLERVQEQARALDFHEAARTTKQTLERAIQEHTQSAGFPSPARIVFEHTFGAWDWQGIASEYTHPDGHARSVRWYKDYKHQGLKELLRAWHKPTTPPSAQRTSTSRARATRSQRLPVAATLAVTLTLLLLGVHAATRSRPLDAVPQALLGIALGASHNTPTLEVLAPSWTNPAPTYSHPTMLVLETDGERYVVLASGREGPRAGEVSLYKNGSDQPEWRARLAPTCEQTLMHENLQPGACLEPYGVRALIHTGPHGNLGERIAAVYWQRYSPTFIAFINVQTGAITGSYAHPGQLLEHALVDITADGSLELVLAGEDNAQRRPALVALDPGMAHGAASSVSWSEGESALARVLLPNSPAVAQALGRTHLRVTHFGTNNWAPAKDAWRVSVGSAARTLYYAYLNRDLTPLRPEPLALGSEAETLLKALELSANATLDTLGQRFTTVQRSKPRAQ